MQLRTELNRHIIVHFNTLFKNYSYIVSFNGLLLLTVVKNNNSNNNKTINEP